MEIKGRPLWSRTGEAALVFVGFCLTGYIRRGNFGWIFTDDYGLTILLVPIIYFVVRIAIDAVRVNR